MLRCDLDFLTLTFTFHLLPLTLGTCSVSAVSGSNFVPNLREIEQSEAELLRLQYLI